MLEQIVTSALQWVQEKGMGGLKKLRRKCRQMSRISDCASYCILVCRIYKS